MILLRYSVELLIDQRVNSFSSLVGYLTDHGHHPVGKEAASRAWFLYEQILRKVVWPATDPIQQQLSQDWDHVITVTEAP